MNEKLKDMTDVKTEAVKIDYEAECKRLTMVVMRQYEIIQSLKNACYNMSMALVQEDVNAQN